MEYTVLFCCFQNDMLIYNVALYLSSFNAFDSWIYSFRRDYLKKELITFFKYKIRYSRITH